MTSEKLKNLAKIVDNAKISSLSTRKNRKHFALYIAKEVGLWEPNVISFVEEMAGLNFYSHEDRKVFMQFAEEAL